MTLCEISPFYCDKGGGIRTFHRARFDWFSRQTRHRYVLIAPGPCFSVSRLGPNVTLVRVYGPRLSGDPDGYRLLADYPRVVSVVRDLQPDVVQANDHGLSGPLALLMRHQWNVFSGLATSFCHSDPIATYIRPWARALPGLHACGDRMADWAGAGLSRLQRCFAMTFVASEGMRQSLQRAGVTRVAKIGFGVEPELLSIRRSPRSAPQTRLLYAGRLDDDKEFGLLLDILPSLLRRRDVSVTVVGTGRHQKRAALFSHPRFSHLGFLADRSAIRAVYAAHDVLLAPGRYETFGLSALEAAAAGLVVVGPDGGGTGELLRQMESPFIFTPGSRASFLDRVRAAADSDRRSVVERGRALAEVYGTWDHAVARHVAMYESLTGDDEEALGRPA